MNRYLAAAALAATTTLAAPALAQAMTPQDYVAAAGASDLYERQSSELVHASTSNPKVRDFARMMIDHHTKSTTDVEAAATAAGLKPSPPKLMPAQAEMIAHLKTQNGPARDAAYLSQQKLAHEQALKLHRTYAKEGTAKPLKTAASGIVPVVERHIAMLKTM